MGKGVGTRNRRCSRSVELFKTGHPEYLYDLPFLEASYIYYLSGSLANPDANRDREDRIPSNRHSVIMFFTILQKMSVALPLRISEKTLHSTQTTRSTEGTHTNTIRH